MESRESPPVTIPQQPPHLPPGWSRVPGQSHFGPVLKLLTVTAVVTLAVAGVVVSAQQDRGAPATATGADPRLPTTGRTPARPVDLTSRATDSAPLTADEVFPAARVRGGSGGAGHEVLVKEALGDCAPAATGALAELLEAHGCSQVVRATMRSEDGRYLMTAGLLNLTDAPAAVTVHAEIQPIVDSLRGRFNGVPAGTDTEALVRARSTLGWQAAGHFLAYCLIVRADSREIGPDDAAALGQLKVDLVTGHLRDGVIAARAAAR